MGVDFLRNAEYPLRRRFENRTDGACPRCSKSDFQFSEWRALCEDRHPISPYPMLLYWEWEDSFFFTRPGLLNQEHS